MPSPAHQPSPPGRNRPTLRLEALEDRCLLSAASPLPALDSSQILAQISGRPNDPQFGGQWGMANTGQSGGAAGVDVHATQAWDVTTGGAGVTVALNDTGIDYNHPDLYLNIWVNQAEIPDFWYAKSADGTYDRLVGKSQVKTATAGVITFADLNNPLNAGLVTDNNGDGRIDAGDLLRPLAQGGWDSGSTKDGDTAHPDDFFGWNFVANNNNPFDDNGHGTNVAGIVGAKGNNGVGVAGLDWNVRLMALKAFDSTGFGTTADIVAAAEYSTQHGAKISNNSWTLLAYSQDLLNAIGDARAAGQIFVVAAGNGGADLPGFPAFYTPQNDNMVSVAAINSSGQLWSNSNYGASAVTLAAPGVNILSTALGGGYSTYTGTSQATPFATGTLALVWGLHPTWTYKQVIAQVTSTVTPLASLKGRVITGGLVNAAAAVGASGTNGGPSTAPTPHVLTAAFSGPDAHSINRIVVTFDQIINAATFTTANVRLTNPAGQLVSPTALKLAPGSDGHQFEIDFNTQTAAGFYTLSIGAGVRGVLGGALAPYSVTDKVTPAAYTFTSAVATSVPKFGTAFSSITVGQSLAIASVKVQVNITAVQDGALSLYLQAPDGTQVLLAYGRGGAGANFQNTLFSDTASTSIRNGAAPFAGSFQPEIPLSILKGKNASGVWKLSVQNVSGKTVAVINSWSLIVTPVASAAKVAGEPADNAAADAVFAALGSPR